MARRRTAAASLALVALTGVLSLGLVTSAAGTAEAASLDGPSGWSFPAWAFEPGVNAIDQAGRDQYAASWWNTFSGQSQFQTTGVGSMKPGTGGVVAPRTPTAPGFGAGGMVVQGTVVANRPAGPAGNRTGGAANLGGIAAAGGTALTGVSLGFGVTNTAMQLFGVDPSATGLAGLGQIAGIPVDGEFVPNYDVPQTDGRIKPQAITVDSYTNASFPNRVPLTWVASAPTSEGSGAYYALGLTTTPAELCSQGFSSGCGSSGSRWGAKVLFTDGKWYAANADFNTVVPEGQPLPGSSFVNPLRSHEKTTATTTAQVDPKQGSPVRWEVYAIGEGQGPADAVGPMVVDMLAPPVTPNPQRVWRTTWTCAGQPAGPLDSAPFTQEDETFPAPQMGTCPEDAPLTTALIELVTLDGSAPPVTVLQWDGPGPGLQRLREEFPECMDGSCVAVLSRVFPDGQKQSCFDNPAACSSWFTEPARDTKYECTYGGKVIELAGCQMYAPTFDPGKTGAGVYYADPSSGVEPSTGLDGQPNPSPGTATVPSTDTPTTTTPEPTPDDSPGLLNALVRAFVPNSATLTRQTSQLRSYLEAKPPTSLLIGLTPVIGGLGDGWSGGCSALPDFSPAQDGSLRLPCAPPDQAGWFRTLLWVASAGIVVATIFGVWHMLAAGLGARSTGHGE